MGEQMLNTFKCPHGFVRYYNDCKYQNRDECVKCECGQYIAAEKTYLAILLEKYGLDCLWISVNDRLPEEKINPVTMDLQQVICFCDFGGDPRITDVRTFGYGTPIGHKEAHFWYGPGIMDGVVTHWMPLPKPPERESIPIWWLKKMMNKSAAGNEELVNNIRGVLDAWDMRDVYDESK